MFVSRKKKGETLHQLIAKNHKKVDLEQLASIYHIETCHKGQWSIAILHNYVISGFLYFHQSQKYKVFMVESSEYPVIFTKVRGMGVESQSCLLSVQRDKSWRKNTGPGSSHSPDVLTRSQYTSHLSWVLTKYAVINLHKTNKQIFNYISFFHRITE